jgi:hypothetical protein
MYDRISEALVAVPAVNGSKGMVMYLLEGVTVGPRERDNDKEQENG